jgi:GAF domain-containing protein
MLGRPPVRSVLSLPIRIHEATAGVLTLYADQPDSFDDAVHGARLLTEHAAAAIAAELSRDRAEQLEAALETSRVIGTAVGILTERLRIPPGHAFEKLREASQNSNRKLRDIAAKIVETGTLAGDLGEALNAPRS